MICCTSATLKKLDALAQFPVHSEPKGDGLVPVDVTAGPPPEQATKTIGTVQRVVQNPLRTPIFFILPRGSPPLLP
jgi:hypothetical protein